MRSRLYLSLNIFLSIPLFIYAYSATFMRLYRGDEFHIRAGALRIGVVQEAIWLYQNANGRFPAMLTLSAMVSLDMRVQAALKIALLFVWWIGLFLVYRHLLKSPLTAGLAVSTTMLALFQALPSVPLAIYWQNGSMIYFVAVVIFTYLLWGILTDKAIWFVCLLAFVVGFYSEVFAVAEIMVFIGVYIIVTRLPKFYYCALCAVAAMILQLVSPGNGVRASQYAHVVSDALHEALMTAGIPLIAVAVSAMFPMLALILLVAQPPTPTRRKARQLQVALMVLLSIAISAVSFAIPVYTSQQSLPFYAWSIPLTFTIIAVVFAAYRLTLPIIPTSLLVLTVVLCGLSGLKSSADTYATMSQFAQAWDRRDAVLREGKDDVCVPAIALPQSSPDLWIDSAAYENTWMALYYDTPSLRACP